MRHGAAVPYGARIVGHGCAVPHPQFERHALIDERFLVPEEFSATLRLGQRDWAVASGSAQ